MQVKSPVTYGKLHRYQVSVNTSYKAPVLLGRSFMHSWHATVEPASMLCQFRVNLFFWVELCNKACQENQIFSMHIVVMLYTSSVQMEKPHFGQTLSPTPSPTTVQGLCRAYEVSTPIDQLVNAEDHDPSDMFCYQ